MRVDGEVVAVGTSIGALRDALRRWWDREPKL